MVFWVIIGITGIPIDMGIAIDMGTGTDMGMDIGIIGEPNPAPTRPIGVKGIEGIEGIVDDGCCDEAHLPSRE